MALAALLLAAPATRAHAPHDVVNEVAMSPAFLDDGTLFASFTLTEHTLFGRSTDGGLTWEEYGLPMMEKTIFDFAFSPAYAQDGTAFAATAGLGVFRTTDRGTTWQPVNAGLLNLTVRSIAVSPGFADDGLVIAATDGGCARSTDGGLTWTPSDTGLVETELRVVDFAPDEGGLTVFIGGKTMHRSDDGGLTWSPRNTFSNFMETLAVSPGFGTDGTLMTGFGRFGNGARVSSDGCQSFQDCTLGLTDPFVYELVIADDGTVFAATKSAGCFRADYPGGAWTLKSGGFEMPSDLTETHNTEALVSPQFSRDGLAYVGAYEGLYITHDRGESWRQSNVYSQFLNRHIVFSPGYADDRTIFCGNYGGGVLQFTQGEVTPLPDAGSGTVTGLGGGSGLVPGLTHSGGPAGPQAHSELPHPPDFDAPLWQGRSNGITALYSDALAISPTFVADRTLFYGYTVLCRSQDAGQTWTQLPKPAGITVVRRIAVSPDFANDRTVMLGSGGMGAWISLDAGDSWMEMGNGLPRSATVSSIDFSPAYAADRTAWIATTGNGAFRSTDGGNLWLPIDTALGSLDLRCFAVSPDFAADRTVFTGTVGQGIWVSQDGGDNWAPANSGLPEGVPDIIEQIVISPTFSSDGTLFLATLNDKVFRSVDRGASWQIASAGLPLSSSRTLEISPDYAHDRTVIAGTYGWTWQTHDGGASWSRLPGGLRVDEGHPTVFRSGGWNKVSGAQNNGGSVELGVSRGAWEEFPFFGDSIRWYANLGAHSGIADVQIDMQSVALVDLYSTTVQVQVQMFEAHFDKPGWHVIRVTNTGTKNPASIFTRVDSDGYFYTF